MIVAALPPSHSVLFRWHLPLCPIPLAPRPLSYSIGISQAYERGIASFGFPHVREIWIAYLTKFVDRYKNKKLERARELYEQAIEGVPDKDAMVFFSMYAKLEEDHGLTRHAMR